MQDRRRSQPVYKIQSTKPIPASELAEGYTLDFDTSMKKCIGIAIINTNGNVPLYEAFRVGVVFGVKEVFPEYTPVSLFQTTPTVPPNRRFYRFPAIDIEHLNFKLKLVESTPVNNNYIFMFLLSK